MTKELDKHPLADSVGGLIQSVPFDIAEGEIHLLAHGIYSPSAGEMSWKRYLGECTTRRIIPFSTISLACGLETRLPDAFQLTSGGCRTRVSDRRILESTIRGGKIHCCRFRLFHSLGEAFEMFRRDFLPSLESEGYVVSNADLRFRANEEREYDLVSNAVEVLLSSQGATSQVRTLTSTYGLSASNRGAAVLEWLNMRKSVRMAT